jgi:hypothetical protein
MVFLTMLITASDSRAAHKSPTIQNAFAKVQRNGKPYNTFYNYYITPHAIEEAGKVFCAYQDGNGKPIVMAYDIEKKQWSGPVRASDIGLGADTHGNPSICIDAKGHIHLFFGCHGRAMRHVKSQKPYDITKWRAMPSPTPRATYPETIRMADGKILLFYRAGGHMEPWSMRISEDNGSSWSQAQRIIEMRLDPPDRLAAAYATFLPGADCRTVHGLFLHKDDNPTRVKKHPWRPLKYPGLHEAVYRYNVYYIKRDAEGKWRGADGSNLELPVSKAKADKQALVYDTGDLFARHKRIVIDNDDRPYLRFAVEVTDWKNNKVIVPSTTYYTAPTDGKWRVFDKIPAYWPEPVRRQIVTPGPAAYGPIAPYPWFIHHASDLQADPTATYVWLAHTEKGYAPRKQGPAASPKD